MKKVFAVVMIMLIACPAFAAGRSQLTNPFASWYNASTTLTTITLPDGNKSRDVWVRNGDATAASLIWLDLQGGTITTTKNGVASTVSPSANRPSIIQLAGGAELYLRDFATNKISFQAQTTASPVSVVITY